MERSRSKVCGIDVHKRFLVATILKRNGQKKTGKFLNSLEQLLRLKEWVITEQCQAVACESTGEYRVSLYEVLPGYVEIIVPIRITSKGSPGRRPIRYDRFRRESRACLERFNLTVENSVQGEERYPGTYEITGETGT